MKKIFNFIYRFCQRMETDTSCIIDLSIIIYFSCTFCSSMYFLNKEISIGDFNFIGKLASSLTALELKAYGRAGAVAEEVFSSIRTVLSYSGQKREEDRYNWNDYSSHSDCITMISFSSIDTKSILEKREKVVSRKVQSVE